MADKLSLNQYHITSLDLSSPCLLIGYDGMIY